MSQVNVSPAMASRVEALLGRSPRGLQAVPVSSPEGEPVVIRVASLVDQKPFPTMFWLVDKALCYEIDRAEASGLIQQFQHRVDAEETLRESMVADHTAHIQMRNGLICEQMKAELEALGFYEVLQQRGIGGIEDPSRIRCLHTWYASHLVVANTIGRLLDDHWNTAAS